YLSRARTGNVTGRRPAEHDGSHRLRAGGSGTRRKAEPEPCGTEPFGAGDELPRIRRNQLGPRPGFEDRRSTSAGSQLRRNDAAGSSRATATHRPSAGHAIAAVDDAARSLTRKSIGQFESPSRPVV